MYIISDVYTGLKGLIGWRQDTNPDYDIIDAANYGTTSGMCYQDYSALVTVENIHQNQNDKDISDDNFNAMLVNLERASINKVMRSVFTDDDVIENGVLFPHEMDWINTLTNDTSFVGYEFEVYQRADLSFILNSVFTAFNGIETFNLLLFHS